MIPLTTDLSRQDARPYFLWDEDRTIAQFQEALRSASPDEWARDVGKLMREARDRDVWRFTSPAEVWRNLESIRPYLGRKRAFWEYVIEGWRSDGLLE